VSQRKSSREKLSARDHPKVMSWTSEALPLPDRIQLLREELTKVQEARRKAAVNRAERPS
jgi:hypothetical protein